MAIRLGHGDGFSGDPATVFDELRRASRDGPADYSGITYRRIDEEDGVFWPCPATADGAAEHPGTPRLFADRFATEDGRANFVPVEHGTPAEEPDPDYPIYLTTGRAMQHYQSGAQTRRVSTLNDALAKPYLEIHPDLADRLDIQDLAPVRVTSRRAKLTRDIREDTVFVPFHWGGAASVNRLTNPALDPTSRMPEFKVCAVRLEPV